MSRARDLADLAGSADAGGLTGRNLIINGAMQVDQRNSGSSVSAPHNTYTLDRLNTYQSGGGAYSVQQQTSVTPAGFGFAAKINVDTIDSSIAAGDYYMLTYNFEGHDTAQLEFGTSSAKTVTLSFYVRSSLTGTFSGAINNNASNRAYTFEYTIDSANTWERKTITVAGDQSGTWPGAVNTRSIKIRWALAMGSTYTNTAGSWAAGDYYGTSNQVNLMATLNNTFYITGVQLEVGEQATPFEHRSFGDELVRCLRYYYKTPTTNGGLAANEPFPCVGNMDGTQTGAYIFKFPVPMRAAPTAIEQSGTASDYSIRVTSDANGTSVPSASGFTTESALVNLVSSGAGFTSGDACFMRAESTDAFIAFSSEL